ncbi:hypothetical protein JTE90_005132 [Oedothorax gibbosus]|uniref:EGF-like domain-containing protein n=1 Tax=Oedothorax gibbosus TaxID=931172 RepID=A0AAV6UNH2_9ARAC|nr:hypothetical protein JTE90_005132 [Oedothorax gibbosus]
MNVFMLGILLVCVSSFRCKALAIYMASDDTVLNYANSSHILDMKNAFIINHGVDLQEKTSQYADQCKCHKGKCVEKDGKTVCTCPPEFGVFKNYYREEECKPCECGKGANCTFNPILWSIHKKCVCPFGLKESDGVCKGDPCSMNPCGNGGRCVVEENSFKCDCTPPFSGKTCEEGCDCGSKSFGCKVDSQGRLKCVCFPGFAQKGNSCAETCTKDTDCFNGGSCERSGDDYFCACPGGFAGDRCQVNSACDNLNCDVMRAVCRRTRDGAVCECPPEKEYKWFTGVCEDICDSRKCVNGKCEITGKTFICACDEGFTGLRCEERVSVNSDLTIYIIGFTMLSAAILLSAIGTFYLLCVTKRTGKENKSQLVE